MMLYFCRHGIAAEAQGKMGDALRPMTPGGVKKFRKAARGFVEMGPKVSHVLTSPLLRARQTAEILTEALEQEERQVKLEISESLAPGTKLEAFLQTLRGLKNMAGVVAVGHEPTLSEWVKGLCFDGKGSVEMKKGAIAGIELDPRMKSGTLVFLLQPKQLRGLGRA